MKEKYHHTKGTNCWYCDREFTGIRPLVRTKDHIVPLSVLKKNGWPNSYHNYIASCEDCNHLKSCMGPKAFAQWLQRKIRRDDCTGYPVFKQFDMIIFRAWKIYNKKSKMVRKLSNKIKIDRPVYR